jgi:hypothetical protein
LSKKLRVVASALVVAWLAWQTDWGQVRAAVARLCWPLWGLAVGLYALTQVISSLRWQMLARPLGFRRPLGHYVGFYFIGMLFNNVLPTSVGGDVVRGWYLDNHSGRRLHAFVSVLAERGSGLLVLLALACVAAAVYPHELPARTIWMVWGVAGSALAGLAALPLLLRWGDRFNRVRRLAEAVRLFVREPGLLAATTLLSVVVQAANVVLVWLVGEALGAPVPFAYYWVLVPLVTLLTLLPSHNGIGVREGGMVLLLAPLGVEAGTAVSLGFLWFAVFTTASLIGLGFYLFCRFPRYEERSDAGVIGDHSHQGRARQPAAAA